MASSTARQDAEELKLCFLVYTHINGFIDTFTGFVSQPVELHLDRDAEAPLAQFQPITAILYTSRMTTAASVIQRDSVWRRKKYKVTPTQQKQAAIGFGRRQERLCGRPICCVGYALYRGDFNGAVPK